MGNISCSICKIDAYKEHNNPVLTIHHLGKYNKYRICAECLQETNIISLKILKFNYKDINL